MMLGEAFVYFTEKKKNAGEIFSFEIYDEYFFAVNLVVIVRASPFT